MKEPSRIYMDIPTTTLINSIVVLLTEAYAGPPDPKATWFIDNEPNSGILGQLENVSAEEASTPIDNKGEPGTTIASHTEHLCWSLANANAAMRGEQYNPNWGESWKLLQADSEAWDRLRSSLRAEFEAMCQGLKSQTDLEGDYFLGVLALVPHAAYHLGTIRQMIERVRG